MRHALTCASQQRTPFQHSRHEYFFPTQKAVLATADHLATLLRQAGLLLPWLEGFFLPWTQIVPHDPYSPSRGCNKREDLMTSLKLRTTQSEDRSIHANSSLC